MIFNKIAAGLNDLKFNKKISGATADCYLDDTSTFFLKKVNKFLDYDVVSREIYILQLLNLYNFSWAPKLHYYDLKDNVIVMDYCGEKINSLNLPEDYREQLDVIEKDLKRLNIAHNDIIDGSNNPAVLVKNKKLYLIDYQWCSINGNYSCDGKMDARIKPHYIKNHFKAILEQFNKLENEKMYQSEVPNIKINEQEAIIEGYQMFSIKADKKIIFNSKPHKYKKIEDKLRNLKEFNDSLHDIGCSNGLVSFISNNLGYTNINALDHDERSINIIKEIINKFNFTSISPQKYIFGETLEKKDITVALAIIHWVYSCTSLQGSFRKILKYLKNITNNVLLLEWVDPKDSAIKSFKHIDYNRTIQQEEYNLSNFEEALKEIGYIQNIENLDGVTRKLYTVNIIN